MIKILSVLFIFITLISCKQRKTGTKDAAVDQDSIIYLSESLDFIKQVMPTEMQDSSFILEDKPVSFDYSNCLDELLNDTAIFSKGELQTIKSRHFRKIQRWTRENLPGIKLIDNDRVDSIFEDKTKGWGYFYKAIGHGFHSFSYPIFFRNYTYCLFYSDYSCGWLCGVGRLTLYRYKNRKWTEFKSYCSWIS